MVVLPPVGQTWTGSSLADMLPVTSAQLRRVETNDWWTNPWMGPLTRVEEPETLGVTTFDMAANVPERRATVVLRDGEDRPVVVAGRYGFGRVTMIGLDLTQAAVRRAGMPNGDRRIWNHVFSWQSPVLSESFVEDLVDNQRMIRADRLSTIVPLGGFVSSAVAMTGTVGALLVGAVLLFGLYWLLAGWLVQPILKQRGLERKTWVMFTAVVAVFAALAWGGAALLRPGKTSISHVTVLDIDGNSGVARGTAYVSLFVPRFGTSQIATAARPVDRLPGPVQNLISSPGLETNVSAGGFIDTRDYRIDAADPDAVELPVRATSKQLQVKYLGRIDGDVEGLAQPMGFGAIDPLEADAGGWPRGRLIHSLPGELTNVRIIVCRGDRYDSRGRQRQLEPMVWSHISPAGDNTWSPQTPLELNGPGAGFEPLYPPFRSISQIRHERDWKNEGLLGRRIGEHKGFGVGGAVTRVDDSVVVRQFELLSFFDACPRPTWFATPTACTTPAA